MLTIVSVSYKAVDYLNYNYQLTRSLTKTNNIEWLVINNSGYKEEYSFTCRVIDGPPLQDLSIGKINKASFHHAAALDLALKNVNTRYVLLSDPDYFRLVDLNEILVHMQENDLSVFGSPYWPDHKKNIKDVPVAYDFWFDQNKVDSSKWTFRPEGEVNGKYLDTGSLVYDFVKNNCKYECTKPEKTGEAEIYSFKNELFGIHAHAKLHLRNARQIEDRIAHQLTFVKGLSL